MNDKDYEEVKERIHSIKGASAYAGAGRVTDHCYWMQYYFLEGQVDKMMDLYTRLIESVVEFRVYYRKVIAERQGEPYKINPEHETCPIADNYKIIKIADYQYKCEKEPEEEIEQLDRESFSKNEQEPEQANEKEYLKSVEIEESKFHKSSNQKEIDDSKPVMKPNNNRKESKIEENAKNNEIDDSVIIKVELPVKDNKAFENQGKDEIPNEDDEKEKLNNSTHDENKISARWIQSDNQISHPALQIENEEADKLPGGMCSCSK